MIFYSLQIGKTLLDPFWIRKPFRNMLLGKLALALRSAKFSHHIKENIKSSYGCSYDYRVVRIHTTSGMVWNHPKRYVSHHLAHNHDLNASTWSKSRPQTSKLDLETPKCSHCGPVTNQESKIC